MYSSAEKSNLYLQADYQIHKSKHFLEHIRVRLLATRCIKREDTQCHGSEREKKMTLCGARITQLPLPMTMIPEAVFREFPAKILRKLAVSGWIS
jgi:hypothetical protein